MGILSYSLLVPRLCGQKRASLLPALVSRRVPDVLDGLKKNTKSLDGGLLERHSMYGYDFGANRKQKLQLSHKPRRERCRAPF